MKPVTSLLISAVMAAMSVAPALAETALWRIQPDASTITITFDVDGDLREGTFETFRGEARFDPAALDQAQLRFEIDTASIELNEPFATDFVKSIDWLFVEEHPTAIYELRRLDLIEGDRFRAIGVLTLRGATNPVAGELTLTLEDASARADGGASFGRKDFGVGVGFSTLFVEIGPKIGVAFYLTAQKVE